MENFKLYLKLEIVMMGIFQLYCLHKLAAPK